MYLLGKNQTTTTQERHSREETEKPFRNGTRFQTPSSATRTYCFVQNLGGISICPLFPSRNLYALLTSNTCTIGLLCNFAITCTTSVVAWGNYAARVGASHHPTGKASPSCRHAELAEGFRASSYTSIPRGARCPFEPLKGTHTSPSRGIILGIYSGYFRV